MGYSVRPHFEQGSKQNLTIILGYNQLTSPQPLQVTVRVPEGPLYTSTFAVFQSPITAPRPPFSQVIRNCLSAFRVSENHFEESMKELSSRIASILRRILLNLASFERSFADFFLEVRFEERTLPEVAALEDLPQIPFLYLPQSHPTTCLQGL